MSLIIKNNIGTEFKLEHTDGAGAITLTSTQLAAVASGGGSGSGIDADTLDGQHASAFALTSHNHDDRYYTETEINNLLNNKLNVSSYTAADVLAKIITVDGSGSGLDADTVDGIHSTSILRKDASQTIPSTSIIKFNSNDVIESTNGDQSSLQVFQDTAGEDAFMSFHVGNDYALNFGLDGSTNSLTIGGWSMGAVKYKILHTGIAGLETISTSAPSGGSNKDKWFKV